MPPPPPPLPLPDPTFDFFDEPELIDNFLPLLDISNGNEAGNQRPDINVGTRIAIPLHRVRAHAANSNSNEHHSPLPFVPATVCAYCCHTITIPSWTMRGAVQPYAWLLNCGHKLHVNCLAEIALPPRSKSSLVLKSITDTDISPNWYTQYYPQPRHQLPLPLGYGVVIKRSTRGTALHIPAASNTYRSHLLMAAGTPTLDLLDDTLPDLF